MKLKPYPKYKDSGVPWLDEIPDHWTIRRQRNVVTMLVSNVDKNIVEGEMPVRLCNYVDVYKNQLITEKLPFMKATANEAEIGTFRLRRDDVVITKDSESWDDIGVSALIDYEADDFICGYHLAILRARASELDGAYLHFATHSQGVAIQYWVSANGVTRFGLSQNAIKNVLLPLPSLEEQRKLVRFLNSKEHYINRFIRNKRRLIALLREQKQAIINQAVTRGIDPNIPLKPSGIPWLGDIPEHWNEMPIKRTLSVVLYGTSTSSKDEGRYRILGMGNIKNGEVDTGNCGRLDDIPSEIVLKHNDLLFNRTNSAELVGKVGIFRGQHEDDVSLASYLVLMRVNHRAIPEYMNLLLNSSGVWSYARQQAIPSLHQSNLNPTRYGRLPVPLPPIGEQESILEWFRDVTSNIDTAISRAEREIELMNEYRTRLISDVVTGKVDVRDVPVEELLDDEITYTTGENETLGSAATVIEESVE